MSHKNAHVLLITRDAQLRDLVRRQRPPAARLRCLSPDLLPDAGAFLTAQQFWLDLDCAAPLTAGPSFSGEYFVYFHSSGQQAPAGWPAGVYLHKPCLPSAVEVLWAGVTLPRRTSSPKTDIPHDLPGWLLAFHELNLKKFCRLCVTRLPKRLGYEQVSLYLRDFKQGVLALAETNHARPVALALRLKEDREHLMPAVARARRLLVANRMAGAYREFDLQRPAGAPADRYSDETCLVAPLLSAGRLWGVLNFSGRTAAAPRANLPLPAIFAFLGRSLRSARLYDRARTEARVDGLTGLFNYRWTTEVLAKEIRRAQRFHQPLSLLMLDLDGLKEINDRVGHPAGNFLLQQVARRITSVLRQFDTAVRVGGDEFLAMLPATDLAGAQHVAQRVLHAIRADAPVFHGTPLPITASVGVTQWREGQDGNRLIAAADQTLYAAKRQGRNRIVCHMDETPATEPVPAVTGWQAREE